MKNSIKYSYFFAVLSFQCVQSSIEPIKTGQENVILWDRMGLIRDVRAIILGYLEDQWQSVKTCYSQTDFYHSPYAQGGKSLSHPFHQSIQKELFYNSHITPNNMLCGLVPIHNPGNMWALSPNKKYVAVRTHPESLTILDADHKEIILQAEHFQSFIYPAITKYYKGKSFLYHVDLSEGGLSHSRYMWFVVKIKITVTLDAEELLVFYDFIKKKISNIIAYPHTLNKYQISQITFSPDNTYFVSEKRNKIDGKEIRIWDFKKNKCIAAHEFECPLTWVFTSPVIFYQNYIAVGAGHSLIFMTQGSEKSVIKPLPLPQTHEVRSIDVSPSYLAACSVSGKLTESCISIWNNEAHRAAYALNAPVHAFPVLSKKIYMSAHKKYIAYDNAPMVAVSACAQKQENQAIKSVTPEELSTKFAHVAQLRPTNKLGKTVFEAWCNTRSDIEKQMQLMFIYAAIKKETDTQKKIAMLSQFEQFIREYVTFTKGAYKELLKKRVNELRKLVGQAEDFTW